MKSALQFLIIALSFTAACPSLAEVQNSEIVTVGNDKFFRWFGHAGRTYFIQVSDPNDHIRKWTWAPLIESGNDEDISYEVDGTADKGFFRLLFTDQPTNDPDTDDFDGDGLSNLAEVTIHQTDPLKPDTDDDGLWDGWEIANFLDPNDDGSVNINNGASGDPDRDGLTNAEEQQLDTDPSDSDSDDDGITDGGENDQGTDPNDSNATPDAEWFILTGDLGEDVEKSRSRTITIPAGESRVIAIVVASDEYPDWTGDQSGFNDTLEWNIRPTGGQPFTGGIDVNSRHDEWVTSELEGFAVQGFSPAHIEAIKTVAAPSTSPLIVEIDLSATNIGDGDFPSTVLVGILPVEVTPDDDQPGKTGDQIASINGAAGEKHYVSPKKSAEIPDDFVVLKATGIDQHLFEKLLKWQGGEEHPDDPLKRRVQRETTGRTIVQIITRNEETEADLINVWVIWANSDPRIGTIKPLPDPDWFEYRIGPEEDKIWKFRFTIQPIAIITADERPALAGAADDRRKVPGHDKQWPTDSDPLKKADTADLKWDLSRQMSVSMRNPGLISKTSLENHFSGQWTNGQPQAVNTPVPFPNNPVEGNDDPFTEDEENDPYDSSDLMGLQHEIGQITSFDSPGWSVLNSWGTSNNQEFSAICNFREFARVQLWNGERENGDFWFRISGHGTWHHALKAKFSSTSNTWTDNGSTSGLGNIAP